MAEPYPQTHPAMAAARSIVNQVLDRFTEALPAGPIDGFTAARQAINDECDQYVAERLEAYAARPEPTPEPDLPRCGRCGDLTAGYTRVVSTQSGAIYHYPCWLKELDERVPPEEGTDG